MAVKASETITLSFMVDVKATCRYYKLQASTASAPAVPTTAIPEGWTDIEPSYTEGSTNTLYTVDKTVFTNDTFVYSAVSKSTSYEAAKAAYNKAINAQNTANEAAKTATNFMQFVDGEGLYVGNKQSGTWTGVRTRMDIDSFDVIDQNGNTLASYGAEMSITPNNTSGYKIAMGNAVTIGTRYPGSTEGYGSVVIGYNGRATSSYAYAEGYQTLASGSYSHAEGMSTEASGQGSHAEGHETYASGTYSHSEGDNTHATGMYSHAEGTETEASGEGAHADGTSTLAYGDYSHTEGINTYAYGDGSHAEGHGAYANSNYSHAEGEGTEANGIASHAEGHNATASGDYSHSEGYTTTASGEASHASGILTTATAQAQFVIGKNNDTNNNAAFIIGNGDITLNETSGAYESGDSSNAFEVDWDGNVIAYGNIRAYGNIYYNIPVCGNAYDVDAMKTTGKYFCGDEVSNKPAEPNNASGSPGWLEVMTYITGWVHQRYSTCNGDVYERNCINGTWQKWRVIFYYDAMTATTAETLLLDFVSDYPFTINIGACNSSNIPVATYSYTAFNNNNAQTSKINANTGALNSTYGTITAAASGITIKSTASYKLYVTVTQ